MTTCLSIILFSSCVGCSNQGSANQEIIELTKDNWQEYLAYQKNSNTTPVTKRTLYGIPVYESTGTFTVEFYSTSNVKYENVNISISLIISTISYYGDKSSIALKDRTPNDWYFTYAPSPELDSDGILTYWEINKSGTLSNDGQISFSEPCKMLYMQLSPYGGYTSLDNAVIVDVREISGHVIVDEK